MALYTFGESMYVQVLAIFAAYHDSGNKGECKRWLICPFFIDHVGSCPGEQSEMAGFQGVHAILHLLCAERECACIREFGGDTLTQCQRAL